MKTHQSLQQILQKITSKGRHIHIYHVNVTAPHRVLFPAHRYRYSKFCKKSPQKAGTYTYTMLMWQPPPHRVLFPAHRSLQQIWQKITSKGRHIHIYHVNVTTPPPPPSRTFPGSSVFFAKDFIYLWIFLWQTKLWKVRANRVSPFVMEFQISNKRQGEIPMVRRRLYFHPLNPTPITLKNNIFQIYRFLFQGTPTRFLFNLQGLSRSVSRINFVGVQNPKNVNLLDPKNGTFWTLPQICKLNERSKVK